MNRVILIDMENMQYLGYQALECLPPNNFEVVFFESLYTVAIPEDVLQKLSDLNIKYSFEWVDRTKQGKNSMDFCIVAYIALRTSLVEAKENYFILSRDRDFLIPSSYISAKTGMQIKTINSLKQLLDNGEFSYKDITEEAILRLCIAQANSLHELHSLLQKTLKPFYSVSEIGCLYRKIIADNGF